MNPACHPTRAVAGAALLLALAPAYAQTGGGKPYTTWTDYAGGPDAAQYSALHQINKSNVHQLELAWFHPSPGSTLGSFNPVIVDGVMYVMEADNSIAALDAATGKRIWNHPAGGSPTSRGINYWENKDRSDRRLVFTVGNYLHQINAATGVSINTFGEDGRVDLREGLDRDPRTIRNIRSNNPGRVFENLIILGSATGEGFGSPPGDIRAYDLLTGRMAWTFHTIPRPGEFGYDTWPPEAYKYAGGANSWGEMALDVERGIVYVPLGSPTFDLYGADRAGANLFGNCLVALDARTGRRLWHFQTVHHDLWDYDLTTAPKLLTVAHNGEKVDIVAQAGKNGFLFVFNRVTGEPLWPIEERPVQASQVPGEVSSPTQPYPTKPPPFSRQSFSPEEINPHLAPEEQQRLKAILLRSLNQGVYTPSSVSQDHIQIPGAFGGANWGAAAVDPAAGMLYVRGYDAPSFRRLTEGGQARVPPNATTQQRGFAFFQRDCAACHAGRSGTTPPDKMGIEAFTKVVRGGREVMPPFSEEILNTRTLEAIAAYLNNPAAGEAPLPPEPDSDDPADRRETPQGPLRPDGLRQFRGPFGAQWLSLDGLPAINPPWSQLVAYDLNQGTIQWRIPTGNVPALAARGITGTGAFRPRGGPVVTAGGLIFLSTAGDHTLRAYDKDNGRLLWEKQLEANPDGIPSVYEAGGRQYVVFCVPSDEGGGSRTPALFQPGKPEAQGYYVFALPQPAAATADSPN